MIRLNFVSRQLVKQPAGFVGRAGGRGLLLAFDKMAAGGCGGCGLLAAMELAFASKTKRARRIAAPLSVRTAAATADPPFAIPSSLTICLTSCD